MGCRTQDMGNSPLHLCTLCPYCLLVCYHSLFPHQVWQSGQQRHRGSNSGSLEYPHYQFHHKQPIWVQGWFGVLCLSREIICADSMAAMIFLGIARMSVYFVYPFIWFLFLSKANFLVAWLQTTLVSVFLDFSDFHHIHQRGGVLVEVVVWIHVFFHLLRWGLEGNIELLWTTQTGITGLIATIVMPFITWPMCIGFIKNRLSFELRKAMHYLSWVWGICLILHAPATHIFFVCGVPMMIYWLNWFVGCFGGTYCAQSTTFRRLENGISMTFDNPKGFELKGPSYITVMLPWISKYEWHAFSVFPLHNQENKSSVCIAALGDWTYKLHATTLRPTSRPAWISGPFLSPFASAINFDNIVTLATGIGITPALCTVNMYRGTRRVNLVWMCRDPSLVEYFVTTVDFPPDAFVLIYYTGKKRLVLPDAIPSNVFIFGGRPELERVITGLIECIETEVGLPEDIVTEGKRISNLDPVRKFRAMVIRLLKIYSEKQFYETCVETSASETEKVDDIDNKKLQPSGKLRNRKGPNPKRSPTIDAKVVKTSVFITKRGLITAVNDCLGYDEFSPEDIETIFDLFDVDGSGGIDQDEYNSMIEYVRAENDDESDWEDTERGERSSALSTRHFFSPAQAGDRIDATMKGDSFRRNLLRSSGRRSLHGSESGNFTSNLKKDLSTWQMMYCGGSNPVVKQLELIQKKYGIDLKIEKFDW